MEEGIEMSEIKVRVPDLCRAMDSMQQMEDVLQQAAEGARAVKRGLRVQIRQRERIDSRLTTLAQQMEVQRQSVRRSADTGRQIAGLYQAAEKQVLNDCSERASEARAAMETSIKEAVLSWWQSVVDWVKKIFSPDPLTSSEIDSIVFDDDGTYGGDQGSPQGALGEERKALYDIVRSYYPDYTDREINQFMKKLNSEGCGYVAVINTIFAAFEGREKEFEQKFGFPMYGADGDLNYDRLLVDFYAATDNHNQGKNGDAIDYNEDASKEERKSGSYNYRMDSTGSGSSQYDREYRTHLYLDQKGVPVTVTTDYKMTPKTFEKASETGYVIIAYRYGNLRKEDGSIAQYIDGGHAMVVTGVTDDGRYIVSSWGEKYYIDPKEVVNRGGNSTSFTFSHYAYK